MFGGCVLLLALFGAWDAQAQGIFTCVDAKGRRLTSDRPIPDCADREQSVLNANGTVREKVGPVLTARERAEKDAKAKADLEAQARAGEDKRRERALLLRYPSQPMHDKERAEALQQIGAVRAAAITRVQELMRQRQTATDEMEFYKKDPSKAPPALRHQLDDIQQSLAVQGRFLADQDAEIKRVNQRFDEELIKLKQLWVQQATSAR
jgi:hypothetical protein